MCENKNLSQFLFQYISQKCMGRQGLKLICTVSVYFNKLKIFHEFYESPFFNFFLNLKDPSISESCIETKN